MQHFICHKGELVSSAPWAKRQKARALLAALAPAASLCEVPVLSDRARRTHFTLPGPQGTAADPTRDA